MNDQDKLLAKECFSISVGYLLRRAINIVEVSSETDFRLATTDANVWPVLKIRITLEGHLIREMYTPNDLASCAIRMIVDEKYPELYRSYRIEKDALSKDQVKEIVQYVLDGRNYYEALLAKLTCRGNLGATINTITKALKEQMGLASKDTE